MATGDIEARVIQKVATEAEWAASTILPRKGEFMIVGDSSGTPVNIKVGNGVDMYPALPYMFDSIQQNVNYVAVTGTALPTPEADVAFSIVGEGTYTFGGVDAFTVPEGHWGVANWSSGAWSFVDMGELPVPEGTETIVEQEVPKGIAVMRYAPKTEGKNLFNENTIIIDSAVSSDGVIYTGEGWEDWKRSAPIPVSQQPYYLSGQRGTTRVSFFANSSDTTAVRTFLFEGEGVLTPQSGENFVIINLTNAITTFSNVQFEQGSVKTEYEPFGGKIRKEYVEGIVEANAEIEELNLNTIKNSDLDVYTSVNKFTPTSIWYNYYVTTAQVGEPNAGVRAATDWQVSVVEFPINESTGYVVIQNWESIVKTIAFYSNTNVVPGNVSNLLYAGRVTDYNGEYEIVGSDIKIKYPEGSRCVAFNIKNASESQSIYNSLLIAFSDEFIPYVPPVTIESVRMISGKTVMASVLVDSEERVIEVDDLALKSDSIYGGDVTVLKQGESIAIRIPFNSTEDLVHRWQQKNTNGVFNSLGVFSVGKGLPDEDILTAGTAVHNFNDNIAPIFFKTLLTATGNHGVALPIATVSGGHDKTEADLFSIWSTPSDEYYLVEIMSATQLRFLGRARSDGSIPRSISTTITHVSGGTNTSTISATGVTTTEVKPAMRQDMIQSVVVDGRNITEDGVHKGEVAELVEISNVPDWREPTLVSPFDVTNAPTMIQNRITYRYDKTNTLGIDYVMNFVRNFPIAYNGFLQSQIFNPAGRTRNDIYFPNSNIYGGNDFRTKVNLTNALGTDVIINNDNVENPDKPVQRCIQVATVGGVEKYGYAHGYAYNIGKSSQANRSDLYRQWELRGSSGKSYPRVLWDFDPNLDVLHVSAYCQYFDPTVNPDATSVYVHKEGDSYFIYMDFHTDSLKAIVTLPEYVHGKTLDPVDVQGVTLLSGSDVPSTGMFLSVELQNGYAYGVFKCSV